MTVWAAPPRPRSPSPWNPVNDVPSGADATVVTLEDTPYLFAPADFGFSDPIDSPPNALAGVVVTTVPLNGTLTDNGSPVVTGDEVSAGDILGGHLAFSPDPNANGVPYASFTFQVRDDGGTANGGVDLDPSPNTMTIDVTPQNDPPVANPDASTVARNAPATDIPVLLNDTDVEGDTLTITGTTQGTQGTVVITGGGTGLTYQPNTGATGPDSFTYTISDGHGGTDTGTVTITISEQQHEPRREPRHATTHVGGRAGDGDRRPRQRHGRGARHVVDHGGDPGRQWWGRGDHRWQPRHWPDLRARRELQRPRQLHLHDQRRARRERHGHRVRDDHPGQRRTGRERRHEGGQRERAGDRDPRAGQRHRRRGRHPDDQRQDRWRPRGRDDHRRRDWADLYAGPELRRPGQLHLHDLRR